jgi:hypothetical protein
MLCAAIIALMVVLYIFLDLLGWFFVLMCILLVMSINTALELIEYIIFVGFYMVYDLSFLGLLYVNILNIDWSNITESINLIFIIHCESWAGYLEATHELYSFSIYEHGFCVDLHSYTYQGAVRRDDIHLRGSKRFWHNCLKYRF